MLYMSVIAFDSNPDGILVTESRRDGELTETDSVQIVLDTFNDNQNAFLFGTNPVGLEYDGQVAAEGQTGGFTQNAGQRGSQRGGVSGYNPNWDGDWTVKSAITERGWETEMAIPLKTLRYEPGEDRTWGFNVVRNIRRKNEQVFLAPIPRGYNVHRVSLAAKIEGLDLPGRRDIKVTPYGAGRTDEDNLALVDQRKNQFDVGVDVKWGVTPNMTADFTVNTDFAQVESDEQQVNLTRFPLFFPEKRPFFLENAQTFQFGAPQEVDLFFTRRIGLSANGLPIPILAGARMSGKMGAYNIGVLDMQTDEAFNERTDALLAPSENFAVVRLQREVGRSNFGGIFVNRQATSSPSIGAGRYLDYNRTYGVDANLQLTENTKLYSYVAGSATEGKDDGLQLPRPRQLRDHLVERPHRLHGGERGLRGRGGIRARGSDFGSRRCVTFWTISRRNTPGFAASLPTSPGTATTASTASSRLPAGTITSSRFSLRPAGGSACASTASRIAPRSPSSSITAPTAIGS